jgi:hypothetical protein
MIISKDAEKALMKDVKVEDIKMCVENCWKIGGVDGWEVKG